MKLVMPLFRRNNKSLKFDFVGMNDDSLEEITDLVVKNGGKVVHDETQPVKFTMPYQFVENAFPGAKLYDIEFIKQCIEKNEIVDPAPYRIGQPFQYDNCVIAHFLSATCDCCISKVMGREPTEIKKQNGAATKRVADDVNDNSPPVRHKSAMQMSGNTENRSESTVTSPNRSSDTIPAIKMEAATPLKRKSRSSDDENTSPVVPAKKASEDNSRSARSRKRGRGVAITRSEELAMIKYLTENHMIREAASGLQVWEEIIKSGVCQHRTANSLYTHFKKTILPNITRYNLTEIHLKKFNKLKSKQ